ncbi:hypothetical protein [Micromonospora radicis]|uniref:hypothetical protein n=1 Tax=Micromonospora radicis TaxID=1894971 RepID=UPI001F1C7854|nr:hypothetical protein [Micromonospora radicis]
MYLAGATVAVVARRVGLPHATVRQWCTAHAEPKMRGHRLSLLPLPGERRDPGARLRVSARPLSRRRASRDLRTGAGPSDLVHQRPGPA